MKVTKIFGDDYNTPQRGAALVTVLFISLLLLTASAAMLTAVGTNSRNTTDVLSETKAYYAAESGLQAAVNVFRNSVDASGTPYPYSAFVANPSLSNWLTYTSGQVPVGTGTGTGYSIAVSNPDSGAVGYTAGGIFLGGTGYQRSGDKTQIGIPDFVNTDHTEISFVAPPGGAPSSSNTLIGTLNLVRFGTGNATALATASFRIDYRVVTPIVGLASIYGDMTQATATSPISVRFFSCSYKVLGARFRLALGPSAAPCTAGPVTFSLPSSLNSSQDLYIAADTSFTPVPQRLVITSTGYGPNGSVKKLEGIVRRNFFDGYDAPATMVMIGPHQTTSPVATLFHYRPGTSTGVSYSGGVCTSGCIPAFGVTDQQNLDDVVANPPNPPPSPSPYPAAPAPQLLAYSNLPSWLRDPTALDVVVSALRITAQHSSRYFNLGGGNIPSFPSGNTGITFCEGSCKLNGTGGGILVVTGKLVVAGSSDFTGLIMITGQEGWERNGGGSGTMSGNIIIAPYNVAPYVYPNPTLSLGNFLAPSYDIGGGGGSFVPLGDINPFLDNASAVSDIVLGVAEK